MATSVAGQRCFPSMSRERPDSSAENLLAEDDGEGEDDGDSAAAEPSGRSDGARPFGASGSPPPYRRIAEESDADADADADAERRAPLAEGEDETEEREETVEVANKTSKEMYAALAKELGLSCRMSGQCRCADCQGGYLRCEGDSNTDGGLGAGTPMFVSEVFGHGTAPACLIL